MAEEPARVEERGYTFVNEFNPMQSFEMLDNWEEMLRIPDECTPTSYEPSLYERRVRVLQKLTTGGGQSAAFFKLIMAQLGYDIDVLGVENFRDFRVGISRVGERLTNSTNPDGSTSETGWAFTWAVRGPPGLSRPFLVGQGVVGDRLRLVTNETLECVIRKFSPAHTTVLFFYEED